MKASQIITIIILIILFIFLSPSSAQNINVQEMIGKNLNTVIKNYGKPVHQDRSNPDMECVFYKTKTYQMVFVANKQGVFQAEGCKIFGSKSAASNELSKLVAKCNSSGYLTDTLNVSEYEIRKKGVKFSLSLFENSYSKKYEVKIKANKTEG